MATIESAVRAMLTTGTTLSASPYNIPDSRITHGFRLQDTVLPAITFECGEDERLSIGASPLRQVQVELRVIADTTKGALDILPGVIARAIPGTYDTYDFDCVTVLGHTVDGATVADGDENQPAELVCNIEIIYTE